MTQVAAAAVNTLVSGRYQLAEAIGSGGMGSVYRAVDQVLGRDVAVKVFRAETVMADDLVRQEREIRLLSSLQHPGLINVFDAGRHNFNGSVRRYLVMELVSHTSLEKRLGEGPLLAHEAAAIGGQIADALSHVHSRGIVHRDVKPANILINDAAAEGFRRTAKLGDFGIAQFVEANRLTSDGTILGTAGYLSPEQVTGVDVGVASDVYSLGLVLLECLTGVQEFPGTVIESAVARVNRDATIPEDLAEEWRDLLRAMTSRIPEERPTALEVAAILHGRPAPELTGTGRRSTRAPRAHRKASFRGLKVRRRRLALMWTLGGLLVAGGLVASFLVGTLVGAN
ncbi:serine/threonine-protein kinase [Homoserinibacter sp. YIM 151385]|uniref:serine/threonine-protein kinase n=1 Tax=Homoserinibacter sp. YIM 151385 TaxID=2985506 RepID=UPI0022F0804E|nr:serine/threonine-protein kinase [Homoserinibacter sp. YIM 151385]WBU37296.1 serine/threonine-protein kinase [Homoserinibacter sp. YIM 151385]